MRRWASLPSDLPVDPNVFELNFSELMPIMNINMSGEFSLDQLKDYGEYLEEKIEDLTEISKVDIRGIDDKEVRVLVDTKKLESLQLSFRDIAGAIQNENMTISGGNLLVDGYRRNVRIVGEIRELEELRNVIIKSEKMQLVRLADVAEVEFDEVERESYARQYGSSVVMLDVFKRSGENQIIVSKKIAKLLEEANYKEGQRERDGLYKKWYENKQLCEEGNYKEGERDGLWKGWYENGQLQSEVSFKEGEEDGLWKIYYENGQLKKEETYNNGKNVGLWKGWHENGQMEFERNYKEVGWIISPVSNFHEIHRGFCEAA